MKTLYCFRSQRIMHKGKIVSLHPLDKKFLRCSIRVLVSHLKAMVYKKLAVSSDIQVRICCLIVYMFLKIYFPILLVLDYVQRCVILPKLHSMAFILIIILKFPCILPFYPCAINNKSLVYLVHLIHKLTQKW